MITPAIPDEEATGQMRLVETRRFIEFRRGLMAPYWRTDDGRLKAWRRNTLFGAQADGCVVGIKYRSLESAMAAAVKADRPLPPAPVYAPTNDRLRIAPKGAKAVTFTVRLTFSEKRGIEAVGRRLADHTSPLTMDEYNGAMSGFAKLENAKADR